MPLYLWGLQMQIAQDSYVMYISMLCLDDQGVIILYDAIIILCTQNKNHLVGPVSIHLLIIHHQSHFCTELKKTTSLHLFN